MDQHNHTPFFDHLDRYRADAVHSSDWMAPENPDPDGAPLPSPAEYLINRAEAKRAYSRVGLAHIIYTLAPIAVMTVIQIVLLFLPAESQPDNTIYLFINMACMYLVGMPLCLLMLRPPPRVSSVSGEPASARILLLAFLFAEFFAIAGSYIGLGVNTLVEWMLGAPPADTIIDTLSDIPLWVTLLLTVLIGPIVEELIYRKFSLDVLLPYGEKNAILVTAFIFGLAHGNFEQLFYAFLIGLVFGYLYAYTRKIRYSVLLHILFNFINGFLPTAIMRIPDPVMVNILSAVHTYATLIAAIIGLIFLLLCYRDIVLRPAEIPLPAKQNGRIVFGNVGMILLTIFLVLLLLLAL